MLKLELGTLSWLCVRHDFKQKSNNSKERKMKNNKVWGDAPVAADICEDDVKTNNRDLSQGHSYRLNQV